MVRIGSGQRKKQPVAGAKTEKAAAPAAPGREATARAVMPWARSVHGAAAVTRLPKNAKTADAMNLPVPDVFDVVTFFRARGEGYARIASMVFRGEGNEAGALTARELKAWYEGEVRRRAPPKFSAAKRS